MTDMWAIPSFLSITALISSSMGLAYKHLNSSTTHAWAKLLQTQPPRKVGASWWSRFSRNRRQNAPQIGERPRITIIFSRTNHFMQNILVSTAAYILYELRHACSTVMPTYAGPLITNNRLDCRDRWWAVRLCFVNRFGGSRSFRSTRTK